MNKMNKKGMWKITRQTLLMVIIIIAVLLFIYLVLKVSLHDYFDFILDKLRL